MCGRFTLTHDGEEIRTCFSLAPGFALQFLKRYNIAPGTEVLAVTGGELRGASLMKWGLIPSWAKDAKIGFKMINARAETVHEKPAFRAAFRKRRCVVPVSGWYEWKINEDGSKTPIYFQRKDRGLIALAGIWESWAGTPPGGTQVLSVALVTTVADPAFRTIHDRMPVVIQAVDEWLREDLSQDAARGLLAAPDVQKIEAYPVPKLVNRPRERFGGVYSEGVGVRSGTGVNRRA